MLEHGCTYLPLIACTYLHNSTWPLGRFWRFLSLEVGVIRYRYCTGTSTMSGIDRRLIPISVPVISDSNL